MLLGAFLIAGSFVPSRAALGWGQVAWLVCWVGLFAHRALQMRQHGSDARSTFELSVLLLVGVHALVQHRGGVASEVYPLTYVAVALVTSFATGSVAIGLLVFALVLGFAIAFLGERSADPALL